MSCPVVQSSDDLTVIGSEHSLSLIFLIGKLSLQASISPQSVHTPSVNQRIQPGCSAGWHTAPPKICDIPLASALVQPIKPNSIPYNFPAFRPAIFFRDATSAVRHGSDEHFLVPRLQAPIDHGFCGQDTAERGCGNMDCRWQSWKVSAR